MTTETVNGQAHVSASPTVAHLSGGRALVILAADESHPESLGTVFPSVEAAAKAEKPAEFTRVTMPATNPVTLERESGQEPVVLQVETREVVRVNRPLSMAQSNFAQLHELIVADKTYWVKLAPGEPPVVLQARASETSDVPDSDAVRVPNKPGRHEAAVLLRDQRLVTFAVTVEALTSTGADTDTGKPPVVAARQGVLKPPVVPAAPILRDVQ